MSLTPQQLSYLKDFMLSEKERILNTIDTSTENYHVSPEDRTDELDQAATDYERGQMLRLRNRDLFYLKKLNSSLEKIESKEYGECEDCGAFIRFERLRARPTAELCIACKDEAEKEENNNFIARQSKSLGKKLEYVTNI